MHVAEAIFWVIVVYAAYLAAGWLAIAVVVAAGTFVVYSMAAGYRGAIHLIERPARRRHQRELEERRWKTWRPKQDLRRLPH